MTNYNALIERANAVEGCTGYGMLSDLIGYLQATIDRDDAPAVDNFCDEINDDFDSVCEALGQDEDDFDLTSEESEMTGRTDAHAALELAEMYWINKHADNDVDFDWDAQAAFIAQAIEKRIAWLATL